MKKKARGYLKRSFTFEGKRYYVYGKTSKELNEKETKKREELEQKINSKINPTVEEYFSKRIEYKKDSILKTTYISLISVKNVICNVWIESTDRRFGELLLKKVTPDDLRCVQNELKKRNQTATVNGQMSKLKHIFCDAIDERILTYNPFGLISPLKRVEEEARNTYHRALTLEEQNKFFNSEYTKNSNFYNVFCIMVCTGMRLGEVGALQYKDIKDEYIYVQRTLTKISGGTYTIGENTKTKAGKRKIPITPDIKEVLNRQKMINDIKRGTNILDLEELVFPSPYGKLLRDQYVNGVIKDICEKEDIDVFTTHAFRDTFATRAIENNMNPKTLQEILGHKDYAMTMNLYCHSMEETKIQEMNNIRFFV